MRPSRNRRQRHPLSESEPDNKNGRIVKLTKQRYEDGVFSGQLMHIYDKQEGKLRMISRDGYYPPEELNNFINVDMELRQRFHEIKDKLPDDAE